MTVGERLTADSAPEVRARHVARYRRAIELAGPRHGTWWDVACGDGYGTKLMPTTHRVGFDKDPDALDHARSTVPRANFWMADLTEEYWWVVEPSRPNVVLCIETLEHLDARDQLQLIRDFARVLRPAGVLVLACPLGNGPSPVNPWHLYEPTADELMRVLRAHFVRVDMHTEDYVSTSGPATQAFSVCYAE